jgi:hypothetical protein
MVLSLLLLLMMQLLITIMGRCGHLICGREEWSCMSLLLRVIVVDATLTLVERFVTTRGMGNLLTAATLIF